MSKESTSTTEEHRSSKFKGILKRLTPLQRFSHYLSKAEPEKDQQRAARGYRKRPR